MQDLLHSGMPETSFALLAPRIPSTSLALFLSPVESDFEIARPLNTRGPRLMMSVVNLNKKITNKLILFLGSYESPDSPLSNEV